MRLETFIKELLFEHDCVIVPGFGGLVANYRSARLNRQTHVIHPPSKHVGFNRNLTQNDGLLVNYIAQVTGMGYKEVSAELDEMIKDCKQELTRGGRLAWAKIGIFFNDRSGNLQFIPEDQENFLPESFGLTPVQLRPIARVQEPPAIIETPAAAQTPVIEMTPAVASAPRRAWRYVAAAAAVPILLAGGYLIGNQMSGGGEINFANLNPFASHQVKTSYAMADAQSMLAETTTISLADSNWEEVEATHENGTVVKYDFLTGEITDTGIDVRIMKNDEAVADCTAKAVNVVEPTTKKNFEIIGGAFLIESNAFNLLNELKGKGYDAHMAGKKGKLHLVAFGSYGTRAEADSALRDIRTKHGLDAWIKRN